MKYVSWAKFSTLPVTVKRDVCRGGSVGRCEGLAPVGKGDGTGLRSDWRVCQMRSIRISDANAPSKQKVAGRTGLAEPSPISAQTNTNSN